MDDLETLALAASNQILQKEETLAQESNAVSSQKTCSEDSLISDRPPNLPRLYRVFHSLLVPPPRLARGFSSNWKFKTQKLESLSDRTCGLQYMFKQDNAPWYTFAECRYLPPSTRTYREDINSRPRIIYPELEVRMVDASGATRETKTFPTSRLTKGGRNLIRFWEDVRNAFLPHFIALEACMYLVNVLEYHTCPKGWNMNKIEDADFQRAVVFSKTYHAALLVVQENLETARVEIYHHGELGYKLEDGIQLDLPKTKEEFQEFCNTTWMAVEARIRENLVFLKACKEILNSTLPEPAGWPLKRPYTQWQHTPTKEFQFYVDRFGI